LAKTGDRPRGARHASFGKDLRCFLNRKRVSCCI